MMKEIDPGRLLAGLVGAELREGHERREGQPYTITLSRDYGCAGEEIASGLAARLNVRCYDRELLEAIVAHAQTDRYIMERLDERVTPLMDDWLYGLISGHGAAGEDYRRHLAHVLLGISAHGGVIVGRGAHLLLARRRIWRVRITGSPELCARRAAAAGKVTEREALAMIHRINRERALFIRKMFKADINDPSTYDIAVNTDKLGPEDAVEVILLAIKRSGVFESLSAAAH